MSGSRRTILFLVDEITREGLSPETRRLVDALGCDLDVVLVAQSYLTPSHRARRLPVTGEFYGFPPAVFDGEVAHFAATIIARYRPQWAVAYGWENPQLVAALDGLDLPILLFLDHVSRNPDAETRIYKVFRHATEIVFGDPSVLNSLTTVRRALDARDFRVMNGLRRDLNAGRGGWASLLRRLVTGRSASMIDPGPTAAAILAEGARCAETMQRALDNRARDAETIGASDAFDPELFLPADIQVSKRAAILDYLRNSQLAAPRDRRFAGRLQRRPLAGFNPLIYASDNRAFHEGSGEDPLAHFIRTGRPAGRWAHLVLNPGAEPVSANVKAAIHGHFHYPDLLPDVLDRLAANRTMPDLFLTTTSDEGREAIARILEGRKVVAKLLAVYPNRGRDIWSFVELMRDGVFQSYAVVGHVHAKRSPQYDQGGLWRDFLLSHLIGGREATMDTILSAFASDPGLGLVFAEEPHLVGWEANLELGTALAARAGIAGPLPNHFEYPVGTMFWARPDALRLLTKLDLRLDEIPAEPLPEDGTILHALERLVPFLVAEAGYGYATTHVLGSRR